MPNLADFFSELKRRRVFRELVVYAAVAFVIIQVADIISPVLNLPGTTICGRAHHLYCRPTPGQPNGRSGIIRGYFLKIFANVSLAGEPNVRLLKI